MRQYGFLLVLTWLSSSVNGQTVQWATRVLNFSSQLTPVQYAASEALGKPNVLPAGGQNPAAWTPDKPGRREFLELGYDHPARIRQIAIAESMSPSALYRIVLRDEQGGEHEAMTLNPQAYPLRGRMLNVFIETTPYLVTSVRLEFDGAAIPGYFAIDAVGITESNYPVIADIPKPALLASGIVIESLGNSVNSDYAELNPLLAPDGTTLFFSRRNHPGNVGGVNDREDIWYSELDSTGHWQLARNMGTAFNNNQPNFISSFSSATPDGKSAIMILGNKYLENGKSVSGVSVSSNVNGTWTRPIPLQITNDYNMSDKANYFLADERKTLLMSVERADSHGDRDLYVSFMRPDSTWTEPRNLGSVINTTAEESAPFLASDNVTLYFSSKGFSGYGGSDLYISRRLDDTWMHWSDPENLGPEINSAYEDLFFNIPASSEFAYYSRGVDENNVDIYRVQLPIMRAPDVWVTVRGKLVDAKTGAGVGAKIIYEKLPEGAALGIVQSDSVTGAYEVRLLAGALYGIRAEAEGHISESQHVDLRNVKEPALIGGRDFQLEPIAVAKIEAQAGITLNNVFFDFDKSELKPESMPELDRIVSLMMDQPGMSVELSGHTCDIGTAAYNMELSRRRAEAVKKYLAGKGIAGDRTRVVYFGESRPAVPNTSLANRRKNRRVEFKIISP